MTIGMLYSTTDIRSLHDPGEYVVLCALGNSGHTFKPKITYNIRKSGSQLLSNGLNLNLEKYYKDWSTLEFLIIYKMFHDRRVAAVYTLGLRALIPNI